MISDGMLVKIRCVVSVVTPPYTGCSEYKPARASFIREPEV